MNDFWRDLVSLILSPTLAVGAVAWLLRGVVDRSITRDLERFKTELARESFVMQTRFSLIHQERAAAVAELYARLAHTKGLASDLVQPFQPAGQSLPQKSQAVADAYNDAVQYFFKKRLFFPSETAKKVDRLLAALKGAIIGFSVAQQGNQEYGPGNLELWDKAYKTIRDDVPPILVELEQEFQRLLGIIEGSTDTGVAEPGT